jgi:hypothetical protein
MGKKNALNVVNLYQSYSDVSGEVRIGNVVYLYYIKNKSISKVLDELLDRNRHIKTTKNYFANRNSVNRIIKKIHALKIKP